MAESYFATIEMEPLRLFGPFETREQARAEPSPCLDGFDNACRLYIRLTYRSPEEVGRDAQRTPNVHNHPQAVRFPPAPPRSYPRRPCYFHRPEPSQLDDCTRNKNRPKKEIRHLAVPTSHCYPANREEVAEMRVPNLTTADDIRELSNVQLTDLVHRLLLLEAEKLGLPKRKVDVSLSLDIPDGGEDGRIEWKGDPDPATSNWLPRRVCLFQMKATDMTPGKCREEVLVERDGAKSLKARVADLVEREGSYILCYSRHCAGRHVTRRVNALRTAFAEVVGSKKADAVDIQVYGAERLSSWANEHASAIMFVLECTRRALPSAFQTWRSWAKLHQSPLTYFPDEPRLAIASTLKTVLRSGGGVARLAGLSGLGKTRLALELFRPPESAGDEPEQAVLSAACVYVDDGARVAEVLEPTMRSLREQGVRAIVVVDECPLGLHEKLEPIAVAKDSNLSLLTLDYDPGSDPRSPRCRFFRLETLGLEAMKKLLQGRPALVPDTRLARIAEIAQGYPRMAHLLVEAIQDGREHLWELVPDSVVERLVCRHLPGEERRVPLRVARALSVFEHVGVDGIAAHELGDVAEHLCGQPREHVYEVVRDLERAGIVLRRGDYVRVTPLPIAVTLAGQWWDDRSDDQAMDLLLGKKLRPELVDAMANQLKRLSGHSWVQRLISSLCGPATPFAGGISSTPCVGPAWPVSSPRRTPGRCVTRLPTPSAE